MNLASNLLFKASITARRRGCIVLAWVCLWLAGAGARAQTIPGYIDLEPRDKSALPTDTARLLSPRVMPIEPGTDPYNAYVPGLQSRYHLTLAPVFTLPYLHVPYLNRGHGIPARPNLAIPEWLYVDLRLNADFVFTDNVHRDNNNRQSDLVIQTVLTINTVLQITDDFQFQIAGNLVYHRALGENDVSGFGFQDYFYFDDTFRADEILDLGGSGLFAAQAGWNRQFGEWETQISDRFYVANRIMPDPFVDQRVRQATEAANLINAALGRMLPGPSRLGMSAGRGDYWYNSHFAGYARAENSASLWFDVQRETMRFQPFANYTVRHLDYQDRDQSGIIQQGALGVRGPVTEQMDIEAGVGYSHANDTSSANQDGILWRLLVNHLMNSTTRHHLLLERRLTPSATSLQGSNTALQYKIGHRFNHDIVTWLGVNKTIYDDEAANQDSERWSGLATTSFTPAQRIKCTLEYQYTDWTTDGGDDYTENRITLSAAWEI